MMMLYSGLFKELVRVPSTMPAGSVSDQSFKDMADQTLQYDDEAMRNGNGDPSLVLLPVVLRVEEPKEQFVALQATKLSFLRIRLHSQVHVSLSMRPSIIGTVVVLVGLIKRLESVLWLSRPYSIVLTSR